MKHSIAAVALAILGLTAQEVAGQRKGGFGRNRDDNELARGGQNDGAIEITEEADAQETGGSDFGNVLADQVAVDGADGSLNPLLGVQEDSDGAVQSLQPLPSAPVTNQGELIPLPALETTSFDLSEFLATRSQAVTTDVTTTSEALVTANPLLSLNSTVAIATSLTAITTPIESITSFTNIPNLLSSKAETSNVTTPLAAIKSELSTSATAVIPPVPLGTAVSSANRGAVLIPGFNSIRSSAAVAASPTAAFPLRNSTARASVATSASGGLPQLVPIGTGVSAIAGAIASASSSFSSIEVIETTRADGVVTSASVGIVKTTAADGTVETTSIPILDAAEAGSTSGLKALPGATADASGSLEPIPGATTRTDRTDRTATGTLASLPGSTATGTGSTSVRLPGASTLLTSTTGANATRTAAGSTSSTIAGAVAVSDTTSSQNSAAAGLVVAKIALIGVAGVMATMLL